MRIWLDDKRPMPDGYDEHVLTAQDAINRIETGEVTKISLDHDLGDEAEVGNGYMVAKHIEERAYFGCIKRLEWAVHSQNSVGVGKMTIALENADSFWTRNEEAGTLTFNGVSEPIDDELVFVSFTRDGKEHIFEEFMRYHTDEDAKQLRENGSYVFVVITMDMYKLNQRTTVFLKRMRYTKDDIARNEKETNELMKFFSKEPNE